MTAVVCVRLVRRVLALRTFEMPKSSTLTSGRAVGPLGAGRGSRA